MSIYFWYGLLVVDLVAIVCLVWVLSMKVPDTATARLRYIAENYPFWMSIYVVLLLGLIVFSAFIILFYSITIHFREPLSHAGIFLFFTAILLLASFFIEQAPTTKTYTDSHPLIFYTAVVFIILSLIAAINSSVKHYM